MIERIRAYILRKFGAYDYQHIDREEFDELQDKVDALLEHLDIKFKKRNRYAINKRKRMGFGSDKDVDG